jgi:hypothetical protein
MLLVTVLAFISMPYFFQGSFEIRGKIIKSKNPGIPNLKRVCIQLMNMVLSLKQVTLRCKIQPVRSTL